MARLSACKLYSNNICPHEDGYYLSIHVTEVDGEILLTEVTVRQTTMIMKHMIRYFLCLINKQESVQSEIS